MSGSVRLYSEVLNREVEVPETPRRIVSLSPAITETLYMLGLEDRIAGVSVYDHKPPKAREKPKVGSYYKVNMKLLEQLNPDLILVTTGAQRRILEDLSRRYPVYPIPLPVSVSGIIDQAVQVGIVTGALEEASRLETELLDKASKLRGAGRGLRIYYEVYLGGPVTAGAHTYISDAFRIAGVETPFMSERTTWIYQPPPERINRFKPQFILYEYSAYAPTTAEKVRGELEARGVDVGSAELVLLEPDTLAHYGPSFIDTMLDLLKTLRDKAGLG
ncbi:ABC transporter, substrate binding protein [Aeropyrum pernix K1]|uniref:ABC transporter, substrate binding protein n=1 Tax=Aeropyrum pernix (strain ATCC 700893 / DSM 11879 / JCM 9820 / NBRC 100138 / K1) TaxID=272557 RepID=Q9YBA9_AERPE|nr:ABC transporter substrate-binding protein [Aeropyrum pernix]BAA80689.2 ABC transporter, substrate binding protein [Aeropyrum pernix K1]